MGEYFTGQSWVATIVTGHSNGTVTLACTPGVGWNAAALRHFTRRGFRLPHQQPARQQPEEPQREERRQQREERRQQREERRQQRQQQRVRIRSKSSQSSSSTTRESSSDGTPRARPLRSPSEISWSD